ncbi:hypothetical protein MHBO_001940 [Bonamia ostreae]|uniref:Uncharacterized protein n=1 Tax=Bonamia ostreae TaxID=126728 RepID=A0ABV2ALB5_9EUKA
MDFSLNVRKNEEIDRLQRDERRYASKIVQKIAKTGCNVLLVQKSIIRDALSPLSLHFLAKKRIMVVSDIERDDIQFIAKVHLFDERA